MLNEENAFKIQHSTFKINQVSETKTISESQEIIQNNQDYTLFSWSKQKGTNPIAVKHAEGVYLYDYDGKSYIDFSSGLMNVNIGHGDQRITNACLLYTSPTPRDRTRSRMPSSA